MAANAWFCQFLADILQAPVERPVILETTALGAAFLAGLAVGIYPDLTSIGDTWELGRRFEPHLGLAARADMIAGWQDALRRALG